MELHPRLPRQSCSTPTLCKCGTSFRPHYRSLNRVRCDDCEDQRQRAKSERRLQLRLRAGHEPDRKGWPKLRQKIKLECNVSACEVCATPEAELRHHRRQLVGDHIVALRTALEFDAALASTAINVIWLCPGCHANKLSVETKLLQGDLVGFLTGLNRLHWPMPRVIAALRAFKVYVSSTLADSFTASS